MNKIIKKVTLAALALCAVFVFAGSTPVLAQSVHDIRAGVNITGEQSSTDVQGAVRTVINVLSVVVGVIAVIMIIIGGLKYITSNGDSNQISSAKNTIIYALIGLVIVAIAQAIVRFVLDRLAAA